MEEYDRFVIRDRDKNLMYQGMVDIFSDIEDPRELILSNVKVFDNETGTDLYDVDMIYFYFEKNNASIEIYKKK